MSPCLLLLELLRNCQRNDSLWVTWGTQLGGGGGCRGINQGSRALFTWTSLSPTSQAGLLLLKD